MGIKNLLIFLKSISKQINLKSIRGSVVAVDAYCWLHKSVITCSNKLVMGDDTDIYVKYCIRYLNLLKFYDIKVILVYDGKNLPAKESVDNKRHEMRSMNKKKAMQLVSENKHSDAKEYFDKCVNITHDIAVKLIKAADKLGFKSIVSPYEADSQLAYLSINGIVDYIITEDSDLLAFGASKVIFKLDLEGNGVLIDKMDLNKVLKLSPEKYSFDKFRYICIIAGCDYYSGIHRVGLTTATAMMQKTQYTQLSEFLRRINMYSKSKILLTEEDIQSAERANFTFLHQIVFDPISKQQKPIRPYPIGSHESEFQFAGTARHSENESDKTILELAIGARYPYNADLVPGFYDSEFRIDELTHSFHYDTINSNHTSSTHKPKSDLVRRHTVASALSRAPFASPVVSSVRFKSPKSIQYRGSYPWIKKNNDVQSDKQIDQELTDILSEYSTTDSNGDIATVNAIEESIENSRPHKEEVMDNVDESGKLATANAIVVFNKKKSVDFKKFDDKENFMPPAKKVKFDESQDKQLKKSLIKTPAVESMSKKSMIQSKLPHLFKRKVAENSNNEDF